MKKSAIIITVALCVIFVCIGVIIVSDINSAKEDSIKTNESDTSVSRVVFDDQPEETDEEINSEDYKDSIAENTEWLVTEIPEATTTEQEASTTVIETTSIQTATIACRVN